MFQVAMVNSTAIAAVAYNSSERVLRIIFRRDNAGYDYPDIDEEVFELLATAASVGHNFQGVRSLPSEKVPQAEVTAFLMRCLQQTNRLFIEA